MPERPGRHSNSDCGSGSRKGLDDPDDATLSPSGEHRNASMGRGLGDATPFELGRRSNNGRSSSDADLRRHPCSQALPCDNDREDGPSETTRFSSGKPANSNRGRDSGGSGDTALFVSGSPAGVSPTLLRELASQTAFVLAVDAGAEQLMAADIIPDLLIGDFDSISKDTLHRFAAEDVPLQSYDRYKNATDVELGVETLHARGYKRIVATNVLGGRTDHALGSLGALAGAVYCHGMEVVLRDRQEACYFVSDRSSQNVLELDFERGASFGNGLSLLPPPPRPQYVSLIAWGGPMTVSIQGTEWPLEHHELTPFSALGVSNELCSPVLKLEVHRSSGIVLLLLSYCS